MTEINMTEINAAQKANNALFWIMTHSKNPKIVEPCQKMLAELQKYCGDLFANYRNGVVD